jgi:hypothetical protein
VRRHAEHVDIDAKPVEVVVPAEEAHKNVSDRWAIVQKQF